MSKIAFLDRPFRTGDRCSSISESSDDPIEAPEIAVFTGEGPPDGKISFGPVVLDRLGGRKRPRFGLEPGFVEHKGFNLSKQGYFELSWTAVVRGRTYTYFLSIDFGEMMRQKGKMKAASRVKYYLIGVVLVVLVSLPLFAHLPHLPAAYLEMFGSTGGERPLRYSGPET